MLQKRNNIIFVRNFDIKIEGEEGGEGGFSPFSVGVRVSEDLVEERYD